MFADGKGKVFVLDTYLLSILLNLEGSTCFGSIHECRFAVTKQELLCCDFMSGVCPVRCFLEFEGDVEVVETCSFRHFAWKLDETAIARLYLRQRCGAALYHATIAKQTPLEGELAQRREAIAVANAYLVVIG